MSYRTGRYILYIAFFIGILITVSSCKEETEEYEDLLPAIRIRILNGCGFSGAASEMSNYLSNYNVDIIGIGNADRFVYDKTIIVAKKDELQDLERLMKATNIRRRAFALSDESTESFQVIVGKDYLNYIQ